MHWDYYHLGQMLYILQRALTRKGRDAFIGRPPVVAQKLLAKLISVRNFSQEDFLSFLHCGSQSWLSSISIFALFFRKWLLGYALKKTTTRRGVLPESEAHAAGFYNKEITLLLLLQSKTKDNDTELRNDTLRKLMKKLYRLFFAAAVFLYHFHCLRQKAEQKNDPEKAP